MAEPPRPDRNGGGPARSAVLLVVTGERRLLLQLRDDAPSVVHPGRWGAFGGGVEPGELPEDAVRREMREETGLEVTGARLLTEVVDVEGAGRLVSVFYVVGGVDPRQIVLTEGTAVGEHDLSDLPDLPMVPFVRRVVESDLALRLGWT